MSFKFKLKVKTGGTGDGAAPTSSQPSAGGAPQQPGQDLYAAPSQQWPIEPAGDPLAGTASQALAPAPSKPMKFKLKVASGAGQAPAAPVEHQWDAPPAAPPPRVKREAPDAAGDEAGAAPAARPIKKIKLTTGKAAGVPVGKKPLIRFKPPAKQPCDAAAAAAVDATAGGGATARGATLPIVRLTLSAVGAPAGGGVRRPKAKALKPKPGLKAGGGVKKAKVRTAKGAGLSPEGGAKRAKRSRSELKELRWAPAAALPCAGRAAAPAAPPPPRRPLSSLSQCLSPTMPYSHPTPAADPLPLGETAECTAVLAAPSASAAACRPRPIPTVAAARRCRPGAVQGPGHRRL